jgi:NAD kinase
MVSVDIAGGLVTAAPIIADFNSDGLHDIIIATPHGYYGYALQTSTGNLLFPSLLVLLLITMAILALGLHRRAHMAINRKK